MSPTSLPAPVVLRPPELVIKAVSDGERLGLQLHYVEGMGKDTANLSRIVLLVQNKPGYLNMSELLARADLPARSRRA
mgnify:CR=1 FL=1